MDAVATPLSGRRAQAGRNDARILESARAVFVADPGAPIAAVAEHAGVGISALYRRYASKEDLLRTLCGDGLERYLAAAETALAELDAGGDAWAVFAGFMRRIVDADTHSLVQRLAGMFTPTAGLMTASDRAQALTVRLFARIRAAGVVRPDIAVEDLALLFEMVSAIRLGDDGRTSQLRQRYLALLQDALRAAPAEALPDPPPTWSELGERWLPR